MAVQKETGGSGAPSSSRQAPSRTGTSSRSSTGTASSSGRSRSPGPPSRSVAARGGTGGAGGSRPGYGAPPAAAPPRPSRGTALYRYLVLPGNESVLLREALERRPWWEPVAPAATSQQIKGKDSSSAAAAAAQQQRWNLWAGLNGQRFSQFELLQPGAAGTEGATGTDPTSRRLVNRLQEHRVICTKSGLAGVLEAIKAAAAAAAGGGGGGGGTSVAALSAAADPSGASATVSDTDTGSEAAAGSGSRSGLDLSWIPETYVVPAGPKAAAAGGGGALARFKAAFARHAAAGRRVWIAKPTCLNRGNGIEVYDNLERIMEHIKGRPAGSSLILQKYIERPLLLGGRKFDIRAYVLVGPDGSVWFHKEAYCRTSSTPYNSSDLADRAAHLTNDAVQKHLDTYHAFEDHCKISLTELGPALRRAAATAATAAAGAAADASAGSFLSSLDTTPGCESGLWGAMRRCVAALFSAAVPLLNPRRLGHCFELLGLDFMLDAEGGLYLIEVNTSPALFRAGAYLTDLLPRLVEEVVQKVVDPLFPPQQPQQQQRQGQGQAAASRQTPPAAGGQAASTPETASDEGPAPSPSPASAQAVLTLLNGFVRVELDEQLATAAATAAGKAVRAVSPGPPRQRAAVGGKGPAGVATSGGRPAAVATVAVGGGVRAATRLDPK